MTIQPGDVFAIKINAHRDGWSGSICRDAAQWQCGGTEGLRRSKCARGKPVCHHLNAFNLVEPRVVIDNDKIYRLLGENPHLLDDQVMMFYTPQFDTHAGLRKPARDMMVGVYRVARVERESGSNRVTILPHAQEWAAFPPNTIERPHVGPAYDGIAYLRSITRERAVALFQQALEAGADDDASTSDNRRALQLRRAADRAPEWLDRAAAVLVPPPDLPRLVFRDPGGDQPGALATQLRSIQIRTVPERQSGAAAREQDQPCGEDADAAQGGDATPDPTPAPWRRATLPEAAQVSSIAAAHGDRVVRALTLATVSKSLLLLAGMTGVGKSRLATLLLDDPRRERSIIVPVASTWRGREDLLGYVNPVSGAFEGTAFCRFLVRAARAWDAGDRRPWLAVFEEFNLSQPEHWMSDLLVRLEYPDEAIADRTVHLGGTGLADADGLRDVFLPPSLLLVGTLNNDHTVRPLSPRVLDRAALITVAVTGRALLDAEGLGEHLATVEGAVDELNDLLVEKGVAFSRRSACSVRAAIARFGGADAVDALDHVLVQEVLSKVRLMYGNPPDEQLLERLKGWAASDGCAPLALCRERVADWSELFQSGRDVFQA